MYLFELLYLNMLRSCPWHNFETIGLMVCCSWFLYFGPLSILLWPSLVCLTLMDRYNIWYNPVTLGVSAPSWFFSFSLLLVPYIPAYSATPCIIRVKI